MNMARRDHTRLPYSEASQFDSPRVTVLPCRLDQFFSHHLMELRVPRHFGENREAGLNPARSRHCDALEAADNRATDLLIGKAAGRRCASQRIDEAKSGDLPEAIASRSLFA
jgi:hypothetical protein